MNENQGIKTWQWVVTVIVIIILIVLGYYLFKGNGASTTNTNPTASPTGMAGDVNRVVVADQYPGNVVYVSSAQLANGGWVVIQKDNAGKPGAVIGSTWTDAGINPVKVTLSEKTVDGGTYYATLHSDDGDKKFDAAKDPAIKNASGDDIVVKFKASTNVTEVKG
jgi:hypothetical protein